MNTSVWLCGLLCAGAMAVPARGGAFAVKVAGAALQHTPLVQEALVSEPSTSSRGEALGTAEQGRVIRGQYAGAAGARPWRLFVPARAAGSPPPMLLVVLHGCTQNANDIAAGTEFDALAQEQGFLVLYPEQPAESNPRGCWNWFDPVHQGRGTGEPAIIAGMTADIVQQYGVDASQVHVVGISAGAAMATLTAVAYVEQFASVTSVAGIPWRAAENVGRALVVMKQGAGEALPSIDSMLTAMGDRVRAMPALVVHGANDQVVNVRNGAETSQQWVALHNALRTRAGQAALTSTALEPRAEGGLAVTRTSWMAENVGVQVELVVIAELGHAWSGGASAGTFTDPRGPKSSRLIADFCRAHPRRAAR